MRKMYILFGQRLYQLRKRKGFTQKQLANALQVSDRFIGRMERGKSGPSFDTLEKLADALEVPVASLFDFEEIEQALAFENRSAS